MNSLAFTDCIYIRNEDGLIYHNRFPQYPFSTSAISANIHKLYYTVKIGSIDKLFQVIVVRKQVPSYNEQHKVKERKVKKQRHAQEETSIVASEYFDDTEKHHNEWSGIIFKQPNFLVSGNKPLAYKSVNMPVGPDAHKEMQTILLIILKHFIGLGVCRKDRNIEFGIMNLMRIPIEINPVALDDDISGKGHIVDMKVLKKNHPIDYGFVQSVVSNDLVFKSINEVFGYEFLDKDINVLSDGKRVMVSLAHPELKNFDDDKIDKLSLIHI